MIVAELIGASSGIGHMITDSQALLATDQIIFGIIVIGVIGLVTDLAFKTGNRKLFPRAFTLPELVQHAESVGPRDGVPIAEWLARVGENRNPTDFLATTTSKVPEIDDPTGFSDVAVGAAVADIGEWCRRLAVLL